MSSKVFNIILVSFILIFGIVVYAFVISSNESIKSYTQSEPSYQYLKSVTVVIYGIGKYPVGANEQSIAQLNKKYNFDDDVEKTDTKKWLGTGVIVAIKGRYTYILTNAHVTGNEMVDVTVFVGNDYKKLEATIIKVHKNLDIALIKVRAHLTNKSIIKGITTATYQDKVYLVGHHLGNPYTYGEGVYAGYSGFDDVIQIPCLFGNSGSGVFNKDGKLVALVYGISGNIVGFCPVFDVAHALAVDGISIEKFLNGIKELK